MLSAAISETPWVAMNHLLAILSAFFLVAGAGTVCWIAYLRSRLKWRLACQAVWINRSAAIASERSRVLEMISSNRNLDELLKEICTVGANLLPGTQCTYNLLIAEKPPVAEAEIPPAADGRKTLFEIPLKNDSEGLVGGITISCASDHVPAEDSEQIYTLLSELATLSMRNSLLYQGLVYHSTHDPLTELPNRRLFESQLADELQQAEKRSGHLAVIYIDVNRFKHVNDKHGHKTGDLYLKQISARLRNQLRPIDTLARVGGDEFIVILPFPETFDRVHSVTARLKACFNDPFNLDGKIITGSASFGFARYPEDGLTAEELTREADHAMYICKYDARVAQEARGVAMITPDELGLALINGDFRLAYQPQFSAAGRLTGMETLLRLESPTLGFLPPGAFISVAERHSVIVDIGNWALRVALEDAMRWRLDTGDHVTLGINVSARQVQEPGYATSVLKCLHEHAFPPNRIEIELIERSLMIGEDTVLKELEQLRKAGVRIALDDFGTEQSCLSLLHKLPIDTIKLDHSFIRAMDDEPKVLPIIRAIVAMARSLDKRVIAEAIEHVGPISDLMEMGTMDFQGYLLSQPLPADEVDHLIRSWRSGIVMPAAFRGKLAVNMELFLGETDALGHASDPVPPPKTFLM